MSQTSLGMAYRIIARLILTISAVVLPVGREGIAVAQSNGSVYAGTYTYHNDNFRTGQNLNETVLSPASVNSSTFGKLFTYPLDGLTFASPLYVANVAIPSNGFHNVVFVVTEHDSIYAFDADGLTNSPLWQVSFLNPAGGVTTVPAVDTGETGDIPNEIGITGTPVIDPASGTLYVVAKTKEISGSTTSYVQRLHALDIATGTEKFGGPVVIQGNVPGTGVGSVGGQVPFIPLRENQRTGLLLANGVVYFGFSSHGDNEPFYGWVMGYTATNIQQQVLIYNDAPNAAEAGIWMNGDGLACDSTGNVYFISGNGTLTANIGGSDYGDSFVKINPAGAVLDYFCPSVQNTLNAGDLDLGSGGVLLLPDQSGAHPHEMVSAGKNGTIYLVDRDNMGNYHTNSDQIVESVVNIFPNNLGNEGGNFCSPVYFNGNVYFSPVQGSVQAFQLSNGLLSTNPISSSSEQYGGRGGTMAISANASSNGILWALQSTGTISPGVLHAYDATNLGNELYNSSQAGTRDTLDAWFKFTLPLVANGKVYVVTESTLSVFGNITAAPTVTIVRPANGMSYPSTNLIGIVVSATANNGGAISKIEFFADGVKLTGDAAASPGTNFLFNPTPGSHTLTARATDTLLAVNTSAAVTITNGVKNSPLGDWEVTIRGADKGAQFVTFQDDFSASGFGIRLKNFGLDDVTGRWGINTKGQVTGPFVEQTDGATNWTGTLLGPVRSLKSLSGAIPTTTFGTFHWRGIPATILPELSGLWTGLVTVVRTQPEPVRYIFSANASDFAVFDIATSADPGTVVGQLLVTSRNRVYAYVTFGGKQFRLSGAFSATRGSLTLRGTDASAERVIIKIFR